MNDIQQREEMVAIGRRVYERGLIAAAEGNFSMRRDDGRILTTPTGLCKGRLVPGDMVVIDADGKVFSGNHKPSSEVKMHLAVYRSRPDVRAVIHAHPPFCIALMLAGRALDQPITPETVVTMGKVPTAPYARPSTEAVPSSVGPYIRRTDFLLLDRHGSLTIGANLEEAFYKLEMLEHTAKTYHAALQIGPVTPLPAAEVAALNALRETTYHISWRLIPFE